MKNQKYGIKDVGELKIFECDSGEMVMTTTVDNTSDIREIETLINGFNKKDLIPLRLELEIEGSTLDIGIYVTEETYLKMKEFEVKYDL